MAYGRSKTRLGLIGGLLALGAMLPAAPARADFREIVISDNSFDPTPLTVRAGDTVVWRHQGQRPHSVKSDSGLFDSSPGCSFQSTDPCMKPNQTFAFTFDQPGTYFYYCNVHGQPNGVGMAGSVTVPSGGGGGTTTTTRPTTTTTRRATTSTAQGATTTSTAKGVTTTTATGPTTTAVPGATTQVAPGPTPTLGSLPTTAPPATAATSSTSIEAAAPAGDGGGGFPAALVLVLLVLVAAGLATAAWYFRPGRGPRPPG